MDETLSPEARASEASGTRPSKELVDEMSRQKILHMRLGPGKHLHGLTLPVRLICDVVGLGERKEEGLSSSLLTGRNEGRGL